MSEEKYQEKGMSDDESQWLNRFKAGEQRAFSEFYEENFQPVQFKAHQILKEEEEVDDIVQDGFTSVWINRKNYTSRRHARNSLHKIVHNTCLNRIRYRKSYPISNIENSSDNFEDDAKLSDLYASISRVITVKQLLLCGNNH